MLDRPFDATVKYHLTPLGSCTQQYENRIVYRKGSSSVEETRGSGTHQRKPIFISIGIMILY